MRPSRSLALALAVFGSVLALSEPARAEGSPWRGPHSHTHTSYDVALGGIAGAHAQRPGAVWGATAHAGIRFHSSDLGESAVPMRWYEIVGGNTWGLDLRAHAWTSREPRAQDSTTVAFGFSPDMQNMLEWRGGPSLRVPSLLGVLVPEVGFASRSESPGSVYTAHSMAFAWALSDAFALEVAPTVWLFYRSERGTPEVMFSVSLSFLYRKWTQRPVRPV